MRLIPIFIGLVASNYLYQWFGHQNWSTALDRSWFETCALVCVWLFDKEPSSSANPEKKPRCQVSSS